MLTLRFDSASRLTLGPSPAFAIEGRFIRQSPHNEIVCRGAPAGWEVEDEIAPGFECTEPTRVQFEDAQGRTSPLYGPFAHLQFDDANCFADRRLFAEFARLSQLWRHRDSGVRWRILNVLPAREKSNVARLSAAGG